MGLAPGQRPFGEGLHFSVLLPLRGDPHLPHRQAVRGGVLPANSGAGDARPYPHRLHGGGREYHGDHAHPGHQPERGHQNGQAEDYRPGCHEDTGAETGCAQRLRYGHSSFRPLHLRRRGKGPSHRPAIPQRENVQHDLPGAAHGGDPAKAGDRRIPGGQRRPDLQLPSDPAGLPAGGRAYEQPSPGAQSHQDRTEPDHIGSGGVRPLCHPGGVHGRRRHVLRPQRPFQQHDPAGPQAISLSQWSCVRHPRQRQIHELQTGDHLYHADDPG